MFSRRSPRRRKHLKALALLFFIASLLYYYTSQSHDPGALFDNISNDLGFLPIGKAQEVCGRYGWDPYPLRTQRRKVYDMFLINTELDWLEIRLGELSNEVDHFIVLEAPLSFTGLPKPLHIKDNWDLFSEWHHKMIYHTLNETGMVFKDTWGHEAFQRNGLFTQMLTGLTGEQAPSLGDVLIVSDVDEIPRVSTVTTLRNCVYPRRLTLASAFYYYSFQWRHHGPDWLHPQATFYQGPRSTLLPEDLRRSHDGDPSRYSPMQVFRPRTSILPNAAWHCSSCFPRLSDMVNKITSFSHTKWNLPEFRDRSHILQRVRHGLDLFKREGEVYNRIERQEMDLPRYLLGGGGERQNKFEYLLNRDGERGGFVDWTEEDSLPTSAVAGVSAAA